MPNYLHRTTKVYQVSVSPVQLGEPAANYIQDPDLSAVEGFNSLYWTITGDIVSLMSGVDRSAVDAAITEDRRDNTMGQFDDVEEIIRAFALVVIDEFNVLRAEHSMAPRTAAQLRTAIRNKMGL